MYIYGDIYIYIFRRVRVNHIKYFLIILWFCFDKFEYIFAFGKYVLNAIAT